MNTIYGFQHICLIKNGKEIFEDQLKTLQESGLYDVTTKIFCSVIGDYEGYIFPEKYEVVFQSTDASLYEGPILTYMYEHANTLVGKYWYIHTKGVNHYGINDVNVRDWRKYMEYFIIEKWKDCVKYMDTYDVCGVNFLDKFMHIPPHFSGNFWWTRSDYVVTNPPNFRPGNRMDHEHWICAVTSPVRVKRLYYSTVDHYTTPYPREFYT